MLAVSFKGVSSTSNTNNTQFSTSNNNNNNNSVGASNGNATASGRGGSGATQSHRKDSGIWMFFDTFCTANDVYANVVGNFSIILASSNVLGKQIQQQ